MWITVKNTKVRVFRSFMLMALLARFRSKCIMQYTYVLHLFVNVTNLKPNVRLAQRLRWILDNVLEALHMLALHLQLMRQRAYLKTLLKLGLLFVYYSQAKVDFIRLVKLWCHAHDL
jgi:hypothetical protein